MTADMVNNPPHYGEGAYQVINVIEAWELNYRLGNVVKYVARAHRKGKQLEDLKKAAWYLNREIEALEAKAVKTEENKPHSECASYLPCRHLPPSTYIAVYTDITKNPYTAFSIHARRDWSIETLAGLVATGSKEWACGTFGISISELGQGERVLLGDTGCLPGQATVDWLLKTYPPERYNYYLKKVGL